ncbi:MAG TPA: chromosome segregation protein SMC [Deltaproteobacteria bacterium]|nr:chromosome segregation protein SMC [Candidatus Binatota bacterium]HIL12893.1 chromosome segregation protein SMC [Deltaproteobacteria bacterium]
MRIKRLELNGFKSCMNRTVLDFPSGVTGIVGPNGCGKSNIVDAIRWVLGEQSARHLRGQSMEDVIFAGNDNHASLGAAEVTIVFDNEEAFHLDADQEELVAEAVAAVRDAAEIQVTRRLFRSGESEYLLNGAKCRLRDITDMFLGTGVGSKAYSIIEQGRVGRIIESKPDELRLLIEEAAGTTLYRSRRLAAERRIERTKENLGRVGDIVNEIERQVNSLKRQARGAVRFKELKAEEEGIDRRLTAGRLARVEVRLVASRQELSEAGSAESSIRELISVQEGERDEQRTRKDLIEGETGAVRTSMFDAKSALNRARDERAHLSSRLEDLVRQLAEAHTETASLESRLRACAQEQSGLVGQRSDLEQQVVALNDERGQRQQRLQDLDDELRDSVAAEEAIKSRMVENLAAEAGARNEIGGVERQIENCSVRVKRCAEEEDSLSIVSSGLLAEVTDCETRLGREARALEQTEVDKRGATERLRAAAERAGASSRRLDSAREQYASVESRYNSLLELEDGLAGYGDAVREFMQNGGVERADARAIVADVMEVESGYEQAVAAVMQEALQYVVVGDADGAVRGAGYVKEKQCGRASFIPLEARHSAINGQTPPGYSLLASHVSVRPGFEGVIGSLARGVVVCESLDQASSQWKQNGYHATFVTLDGETLSRSGVVTGGNVQADNAFLLQRKAELRSVEVERGTSGVEREQATRVFQEARSRVSEVESELDGLDEALRASTLEKVACEGELELKNQNLARTRERLGVLGREKGAVLQERQQYRQELVAARQQLEQTAIVRTRLEGELAGGKEKSQAMKAERDSCGAGLEKLKIQLAEFRVSRDSCEQRLRANDAAVADLSERLSGKAEIMGRDSRERGLARGRLASPELDLGELEATADAVSSKLLSMEAQLKGYVDSLSSLETDVVKKGRELEEIRERKSTATLAVRECDLEFRSIEDQLKERLGVTAGELMADRGNLEQAGADQDTELVAELDAVRNRIRRLGTVNVGAVTELEEVEARFVELGGQRDDLEKSIEDLKGTISRLNRMSRDRFKETFETVNSIFQETFPRMFQGGKASLSLCDENNILESGVEISVQPPGKRAGTLALLSGGEKALTAVSLIFSIFLHKPSPFCILDEVDAPLDDANIGRFARMVADMSDKSQFLLITHNKKTMDSCGMLYGVTMNEPGISKIVSVDLAA